VPRAGTTPVAAGRASGYGLRVRREEERITVFFMAACMIQSPAGSPRRY